MTLNNAQNYKFWYIYARIKMSKEFVKKIIIKDEKNFWYIYREREREGDRGEKERDSEGMDGECVVTKWAKKRYKLFLNS